MKPLLFRDIAARSIPIPPVTSLNSNNWPYANFYDESRTFHDRINSTKRRRRDGLDDLFDAVFDLTNDFPPVVHPDQPAVDVASIKTILVEATAMVEHLKPLLGREEILQDPCRPREHGDGEGHRAHFCCCGRQWRHHL